VHTSNYRDNACRSANDLLSPVEVTSAKAIAEANANKGELGPLNSKGSCAGDRAHDGLAPIANIHRPAGPVGALEAPKSNESLLIKCRAESHSPGPFCF